MDDRAVTIRRGFAEYDDDTEMVVSAASGALDALLAENQDLADLYGMARAERVALLAENQWNAHKVAAYDAARATVKIEGNTRAYYVLRAEAAEAENQRLRDALRRITVYDWTEGAENNAVRIARKALTGDTA